jgi:hypothetical protein
LNEGLKAQENDVMGNTSWNFGSLLENKEIWERRASDCNRTIEKIMEISNTVATAIDYSNPIIMGHGLGSFTAQMLIGAKINAKESQNKESLNAENEGSSEQILMENKYWGGAILMSPYGSGVLGLTENSWSNIDIPFLIITGKESRDLSQQNYEQKSEMYIKAPGYYRHLGILEEGGHTIFSGQRAIRNTKEFDIFKDVKGLINLFLSAYTQSNEGAFNMLYNPEKFKVLSYEYMELLSK